MAAIPDFTELRNYFSKKSMMEILGVDRDENAHSKFLGWLFENEVTGKDAISLFINMLPYERKISAKEINDVKVVLEDFVEVNGYHGRADIVIDVTYSKTEHLYVVIENKIDSLEHKMGIGKKSEDAENAMWQTEGYNEYYSAKYDHCAFVFLTRPNLSKENGPQCDNFKWKTYQDILNKVLVPLKKKLSKRSEEWIRINDYIRCLEINKTQDNLIAISKELLGLANNAWDNEANRALFERLKQKDAGLNSFWEENKHLIQPLFKVLRYMYPVSESEPISDKSRSISEIDKVVNGKDTTKYDLCFDGREYKNLSKNRLVKKTVELYIDVNKCNGDIKDVMDAFPSKLRMLNKGTGADPSSLSNQVVKEAQSKPNDWKPLDVEGRSNWYVNQTGWDGKAMMNYFIEHAKTLLPGLQIHEVVPNEDNTHE